MARILPEQSESSFAKSYILRVYEVLARHNTFRHTFSTLLKSNGEDVKVVQELLRHSTSRMTLDTYTQALSPDKRAAQSRVVGMIRPKTTCTVVVPRETDQITRKSLKRFGVPDGI